MQNFLMQLEEKYLLEIKEFYFPYFSDKESLDSFINRIFQFDWNDRKPRQMLFQVQRFVTLANDIDKIRPARDGVRMMFINCCLESLQSLSGMKKTQFGVPAIEQVHPKRRAFNQKRYNISVLCRFYFYIIFSIA